MLTMFARAKSGIRRIYYRWALSWMLAALRGSWR